MRKTRTTDSLPGDPHGEYLVQSGPLAAACALMSNSRALLVLFPLFCFSTSAQTVVSVTSGVINYSEGTVFVDNNKLLQKFGTFPTLQAGSTIRTEDGRVELLLTPGSVLRLDHNSSVRLVSNARTDTKVEFVKGSVILDSTDADSMKSLLVRFSSNDIHFSEPGVYRVDADPPTLQVYSGKAEFDASGKKTTVDASHMYFFDAALDTPKLDDGLEDEFYQWAHDRSETILADNRITDGIKDSGSDPNADADTDNDTDDDASSLLLPGGGAGLPNYSVPAPNPSLMGPLPGGGYSSPGYSGYPYNSLGTYPSIGFYSNLGMTPFPIVPVYVLPRGYYGYRGSTSAAQAQYWRERQLQLQVMQNRMWQYRATHLPPASLGINRPYTSSFAPTHSFAPHPMPRPMTPAVPHPAISGGIGHGIGHR